MKCLVMCACTGAANAVTPTFSRYHPLQPSGGHSSSRTPGPGGVLHQHSSDMDGVGVYLRTGEREGGGGKICKVHTYVHKPQDQKEDSASEDAYTVNSLK